MQALKPASIFDLVANAPLRGSRDASALHSIFELRQSLAQCTVPHELSAKYGKIYHMFNVCLVASYRYTVLINDWTQGWPRTTASSLPA